MRAVAAGDRDAMQDVYQLTSAKLLGIALHVLRDRDKAEDVLQSVYLTVWQRAVSFDPDRASPITWMATITRNRAIDALRSERRVPTERLSTVQQAPDPARDALTLASDSEEAQRLQDCLETLPGQHSAAIRQAFWGGDTYRILAEQAEVPLPTMKSRIRRALMRLRDCLAHD